MYEPDFDEILNDQPIFYKQIITIKRLCPGIEPKRVQSFTATEASIFINSIRTKKTMENYRRLNLRWSRARVSSVSEGPSQGVSATIEVLHDQTESRGRSSSTTKTLLFLEK